MARGFTNTGRLRDRSLERPAERHQCLLSGSRVAGAGPCGTA